jgi:error-prone DNA polymerase
MGWNNPPAPWSKLHRTLSGAPVPTGAGDGGDSPAWTRWRQPYQEALTPPAALRDRIEWAPRVPTPSCTATPTSASWTVRANPKELIEEAARLETGCPIALTDHDGLCGVVRFAEAAREFDVRAAYGTELSSGLSVPQNGSPCAVAVTRVPLARRLVRSACGPPLGSVPTSLPTRSE